MEDRKMEEQIWRQMAGNGGPENAGLTQLYLHTLYS